MFLNPQFHIKNFMIGEGMHVADFGAGTGAHTFALAEKVGKDGKVYAIEIQSELVKKLQDEVNKNGLKNVIAIESDLEKEFGSGLADKSVDRVFISNVLDNAEAKHVIIEEANRVLKHKGLVIIIDWLDKNPSMEKMITFAEEYGFVFHSQADAGEAHYAIFLRKFS